MEAHKLKRGSALISALFIMTLVAIGATAMSARLQLDIYRTRLTITSDSLFLASEAVSFWAMDLLADEKPIQSTKNGVINYPKSLYHLYPDIETKGSLIDLQSKFNLNNLQDAEQFPGFYRLLKLLSPQDKQTGLGQIINATRDWIKEAPGQAKNEFSIFYAKQNPPYQAAHQGMRSISELRLIQGVDEDIYKAILPYITTLPTKTPINLNTASRTILMILGQGLDESQAQSIIDARGDQGFQTIEDANELLTSLHIPLDQVTLESNYFLSTAITQTKENQSLVHYVVLKRQKNNQGEIKVRIIFDSLNAL